MPPANASKGYNEVAFMREKSLDDWVNSKRFLSKSQQQIAYALRFLLEMQARQA